MRSAMIVLSGAAFLAPAAQAHDVSTLRAIGQGRALYLNHCTGCHGTDARGGFVETAAVQAPDLTRIADRDGAFDAVHVMNHVGGRFTAKPGNPMPRWIYHLRADFPVGDGWADVKVYKLVKYLEWIQEPSAAAR